MVPVNLLTYIPAANETIFNFGSEHLAALLANVGALLSSFWPIILLVSGLALAMTIVLAIIEIADEKDRKKLDHRINKVVRETDRLLDKNKKN